MSFLLWSMLKGGRLPAPESTGFRSKKKGMVPKGGIELMKKKSCRVLGLNSASPVYILSDLGLSSFCKLICGRGKNSDHSYIIGVVLRARGEQYV
jgi:hypothetical protein